jgi:hypothetical protein
MLDIYESRFTDIITNYGISINNIEFHVLGDGRSWDIIKTTNFNIEFASYNDDFLEIIIDTPKMLNNNNFVGFSSIHNKFIHYNKTCIYFTRTPCNITIPDFKNPLVIETVFDEFQMIIPQINLNEDWVGERCRCRH